MEKAGNSVNKKKPLQESNGQQKLTVFFTKNSNPGTSHIKDDIKSRDVDETNKEKTSKRRISEDDVEPSFLKAGKYTDGTNPHSSQSKENQPDSARRKPDLTCDTQYPRDTDLSKSNDETVDSCKENVDSLCNKGKKGMMQDDTTVQPKTSDKQSPAKEPEGQLTEAPTTSSKHSSSVAVPSCSTDDFSDCFVEEWPWDNTIDFGCLQKCKVVDFKREKTSLILNVKSVELDTCTGTVTCSGFWKDARVEKDYIVAIEAKQKGNEWVVDNDNGFLIVHPDFLVSGTTIVGGIFCLRKAVLAEKFKKIEGLPYQEGDQTAMVIGSLAHQLLQKAISETICELADVERLMNDILESKATSVALYASNITLEACRQQMQPYAVKIYEFIQHYMKGKKQQKISNVGENFKGRITHVRDIEENIWLPKLGLKGKVDVTVEVKIHSRKQIMPLEIKTGRPTFSLEHRGQIILYIMMMALTGRETDTGLLLYLKENSMQEIRNGHPEKRDLILLRNTLANYLKPVPAEQLPSVDSPSNLPPLELPEPINHPSACSKCVYNTVCCTYLSRDSKAQLPESHPLSILSKEILKKIKPSHIDYVLQWVSLLQIEEVAQNGDILNKNLWTMCPRRREAKCMCICYLRVEGEVTSEDSKYRHTFVRSRENPDVSHIRIPCNDFSENEYVLVSTGARVNISAGFIVDLTEEYVMVMLERDITKYYTDGPFHIDKYSSSSLLSFNLANVGGLMGNNEICERLREIVIDKRPASFKSRVPRAIVKQSARYLRPLNDDQKRAVLKIASTNDYVLLKGMPGTGKTQTLVALIQLLHKTGHSVLVTSHTNSALDNILLKLLERNVDFLRLGTSQHYLLREKCEAHALSHCDSPDSIEAVYARKSIIGATCYGAHHALLGKRTFDVCLVDECAQALQPAVLRPLYSAHKFVLVGDTNQLAPIVKSKLAKQMGADESLFARLDNDNNTIKLTKQYRMNKTIMDLANKLTYGDALQAGTFEVANATLYMSRAEHLPNIPSWLGKVLSQDISESVILLDTGCTMKLHQSGGFEPPFDMSDQVNSNAWEAALVAKIVQICAVLGVDLQEVGVIAPYRAQVALIKEAMQFREIEVSTVDQYQGRDKNVIIYSCAKSIGSQIPVNEELEILGDNRRLTVAITRAKHKLIIIADVRTISRYSGFKKLFSFIDERNVIKLSKLADEFSWSSVTCML